MGGDEKIYKTQNNLKCILSLLLLVPDLLSLVEDDYV